MYLKIVEQQDTTPLNNGRKQDMTCSPDKVNNIPVEVQASSFLMGAGGIMSSNSGGSFVL